MGMTAAGAYIWYAREHQSKSRIDAAAYVRYHTNEGTTDVQVMRIEKGQHTKAEVLALLVDFVGGNPAHIQALLIDRSATTDEARELARAWFDLDTSEREYINRVALTTDPGKLRDVTALQSLIQELKARVG